jgi:hypothetical protein
MTEGTQKRLVWVISQPSPGRALANFAAYLKRRRAENDGDDNRLWIGKHKGKTYRQIYYGDQAYVYDFVQEVSAILRKSSEARLSDCLYDAHCRLCMYSGGAEGTGHE